MSDPTPAAAEARATKATVGRERADEIVDAFSDWMYSSSATNNHGWEWLRRQIAELPLPPPVAKDGAAPSPEPGWRRQFCDWVNATWGRNPPDRVLAGTTVTVGQLFELAAMLLQTAPSAVPAQPNAAPSADGGKEGQE